MTRSLPQSKNIWINTLGKEPDLAMIEYLQNRGNLVTVISRHQESATSLPLPETDIALLDLSTSMANSLPVIVRIRDGFQGPLIVIDNNPVEAHHILSLEIGADDYLGRPLSIALLSARIHALTRRTGTGRGESSSSVSIGSLQIDAGNREVSHRGEPVNLTTAEFNLLWYLACNAGTVVSRNDIHLAIYNREHNGLDRSIDMYVSRLRKKLGDDPSRPRLLKTVRGGGYLISNLIS